MSARPVALLAAVAAAAVGLLAVRRRAVAPPVEAFPTPPLVQRPAPAPASGTTGTGPTTA